MHSKYSLISIIALLGSLLATPSYSDHHFFFAVSTNPAYGEQLTFKTDWTIYNNFTGTIGPTGFALVMLPGQTPNIPIPGADVTVTTSDGSATCLLHVQIGDGPVQQVDVDPTCSQRIVFNGTTQAAINWPTLVAYTLQFTLLAPEKK